MRRRYSIEASVFRGLLAAARVLPRRVVLALGSVAGRLGYHLDRRHTEIALANLRLAYGPDMDPTWARGIVRRCWSHFARTTADSIVLYRTPLERVRALVDYEGLDHLREAYENGRGALFFTGHFGNWELTGMLQGYLGFPLAVVARPLDNPALEQLLAELRQRTGNRVLHKRSAVREMLRAVRHGEGVAIVIDQDARTDGVFVPFFGRPASTTPTLALVALRTGAMVVPAFSVPLDDGRYRIVYEAPVHIATTGERERDVLAWTTTCTGVIERWVRRYPELWLWMHRRWKTPPPPGWKPGPWPLP